MAPSHHTEQHDTPSLHAPTPPSIPTSAPTQLPVLNFEPVVANTTATQVSVPPPLIPSPPSPITPPVETAAATSPVTPALQSPTTSSSKSGPSNVTVAIAIAASAAVLLILALAACLCLRRRRRILRAHSLNLSHAYVPRHARGGDPSESKEAFGQYEMQTNSTPSLALSELQRPQSAYASGVSTPRETNSPRFQPVVFQAYATETQTPTESPYASHTQAVSSEPPRIPLPVLPPPTLSFFPTKDGDGSVPRSSASMDSLASLRTGTTESRSSHETIPTPPTSPALPARALHSSPSAPPGGKQTQTRRPDFARLLFAAGLNASASSPPTATEDVFIVPSAPARTQTCTKPLPPSISLPLPRLPELALLTDAPLPPPSIVITDPRGKDSPRHKQARCNGGGWDDFSEDDGELNDNEEADDEEADANAEDDAYSYTAVPARAIALSLAIGRPKLPTSFPTSIPSFPTSSSMHPSPASPTGGAFHHPNSFPVSPCTSTTSLSSSSSGSSEAGDPESPSPTPRKLHIVRGEAFDLVTPPPPALTKSTSAGLRGLGLAGFGLPTIMVTEWAEDL